MNAARAPVVRRICAAPAAVAAAAVLLAGCGGGGGHVTTVSNSQALRNVISSISITPAPANSSLYIIPVTATVSRAQLDWPLVQIGAQAAHSQGHIGEGVTVGLIDTGVDVEHWELAGKLVNPESAGDERLSVGQKRQSSHGTSVGGVIVGSTLALPASITINVAESGTSGVAPGVSLYVYPISLGNPPSRPYRPLDPASQFLPSIDVQYADRFGDANSRVMIVNNSFGFEGIITEPIYSSVALMGAFGETIMTVAQEGVDDADKTIYVWAAGNSHGRKVVKVEVAASTTMAVTSYLDANAPNVLSGLPHYMPHIKKNYVAVVAVKPNGQIASYSNRCGVAADFCIAAPGGGISTSERVWVPASKRDSQGNLGRGYGRTAGTSIAAPHVSGALAVLMEAFPSMGATEVLARMLATADSTGVYAEATIYGAGLLDLDAALNDPVGSTGLLYGSDLEGARSPVASSRISPAAAFGDALAVAVRGVGVVAYDDLDTPFARDLADLVERAGLPAPSRSAALLDPSQAAAPGGTRFPLGRRLAAVAGSGPGGWFGLDDASDAFGLPHLSLLGDGAAGFGIESIADGSRVQAAVFLAGDDSSGGPVDSALMLEYGSPGGRQQGRWLLHAGLLAEGTRFLGGSVQGAFGDNLRARTVFAGLQGERELAAGWRARGSVHAGISRPSLQAGMLRQLGPAATSSWALGLARRGLLRAGDSLELLVRQPLRAESGRARLEFSSGRTRYRQVLVEGIDVDLRPSGRQIDFALVYASAAGQSSGWRLAAGCSRQPGHSRAASADCFLQLAASIDL